MREASLSAIDLLGSGEKGIVVVIYFFLGVCLFLGLDQLVSDLIFVEKSSRQQSSPAVFISLLDLPDVLLQRLLLLLNPFL